MLETAEQLLMENQRRSCSVRSTSTGIRKYKMVNDIPENYIVLDFETTGPRPGADKIIKICAIKYRNNEKKDVYQTLINPRRYIPAPVTKQVKISNFMVEGAPFIEDKIYELLEFTEQLPIITHNAPVSMNFLYATEHIDGIQIPELEVIDTVRLARKRLAGFDNQTITELTECLQLEKEGQEGIASCYTINKIYQLCINRT